VAGRIALVVASVLIWTAIQGWWLTTDERIPDGDEMGNVGAVELFWSQAHAEPATRVLWRAYTDDFGEYPALYPALMGIGAARAGVVDLNGDGPAWVGLVLWAWPAALATAAMAAALALRGGLPVGATTIGATLLLLGSPLWSALQRHVMLENGVTALVAACAACVFWARVLQDQGSTRRLWALWVLAGVTAAGAMLVKQTAILALAPLAVAVLVFEPRRRRAAAWIGPVVACTVAIAVSAPWYLERLSREGGYLLRSAAANPDAVGGLHQLVYYPLVLVQEAWAPALLVAGAVGFAITKRRAVLDPDDVAGAGRVERRPERWRSAGSAGLVVVLGIAALLVIPKKYARLVLPLLPFAATAIALLAAHWGPRVRPAFGALIVASWISTTVASPGVLGTSSMGLTDLDERCTQRWIEPPDGAALPWEAMLAVIESAEGEVRVGSIRWPVPPCAHQTTHDLGEHLRVRARRRGLEAWIGAGERWTDGAWTSEGGVAPHILIHEGEIEPSTWAAACGRSGVPSPIVSAKNEAPDWPLEIVIYACR
jgi:hypothetical protein